MGKEKCWGETWENVSLRDNLKDVELIDFPGCLHSRQGRRRQNTLNCVILLRAPLHYGHPSIWVGGWGGEGRGGGSEEVFLSTNRLAPLHCTLQSAYTELWRTGPGTRQKVLARPGKTVANDVVLWLELMGYLMLDFWRQFSLIADTDIDPSVHIFPAWSPVKHYHVYQLMMLVCRLIFGYLSGASARNNTNGINETKCVEWSVKGQLQLIFFIFFYSESRMTSSPASAADNLAFGGEVNWCRRPCNAL